MTKNSIPRHIGFIPDGNRRWAIEHGLPKEAGYAHGINPGLLLYENAGNAGSTKHPSTALPRTTPGGLPYRNSIQHGLRCIRLEIARRGACSACCRR